MILLKKTLPAVLPVLMLSLAASADEGRVVDVIHADGTIGHYQLLPVTHDPAHAAVVQKRLALHALSASSVPSSYSISPSSLPAVRDQGQRGTCAYFATVGILETYYMHQSPANSSLTLSEECLVDVRNWMSDQGSAYTGDDAPSARPDPNGDFPTSIIKTVTEKGVPTADKFSSTIDCTYDGDNTQGNDLALTDYLSTFTSVAKPSFAYGKGLTFDQSTAPTVDMVKALIASGVPVEVGIVVYNEYMNETDWRFDPTQDTSDNIAGGHAIMLTGYDTQNGKTIFTFKNSWNTTWGNAGYGTIDDGILTNSWAYDPGFDFIASLHD